MDILEKAQAMERKGIHVIHLEVGEPDFDTPSCISEAATRALADGQTHYTHSMGILELREAIAAHYARTYDVQVDPDQVVVGNGTSPLFSSFYRRSLNPTTRSFSPTPIIAATPTLSISWAENQSL